MKPWKITLLALPCVVALAVVISLVVARNRLHNETTEMSAGYAEQLTEIEAAPDEVEYVEEENTYPFYEVPRTQENLAEVIRLAIPDESRVSDIATVLTHVATDIDAPWMLTYSRDKQEAFVLTFDGRERIVTCMCYNGNAYVAKDNGDELYLYYHNGHALSFSSLMTESVQYLLTQQDDWEWTDLDATVVQGYLQEKYPNVEYTIENSTIFLANGKQLAAHAGVLSDAVTTEVGSMYSIYEGIASNSTVLSMQELNWRPADTYNILSLLDVVEEEGLSIPEEDLVAIFVDKPTTMYENWTYYLDDQFLRVTTVERADWMDTGKREIELFKYNLQNGTYIRNY